MDTDWDAPLLVYLPMNGHIPGLSHPVASVWCLYLKLRIPASEYKLQLYLGEVHHAWWSLLPVQVHY